MKDCMRRNCESVQQYTIRRCLCSSAGLKILYRTNLRVEGGRTGIVPFPKSGPFGLNIFYCSYNQIQANGPGHRF